MSKPGSGMRMTSEEFGFRNHWDGYLTFALSSLMEFSAGCGRDHLLAAKMLLGYRAALMAGDPRLFQRVSAAAKSGETLTELQTGSPVEVSPATFCAINGVHPDSCLFSAIVGLSMVHRCVSNEKAAIAWINLMLNGQQNVSEER